LDIPAILAAVLDDYSAGTPSTVEDVLEADRAGRELAHRAANELVLR
jgi:1-deoxy-D-xylulose 5-phosphate reductoisomerase